MKFALFLSLSLTEISTMQWVVRRVHDDSYTIEWTVRMGPPVYLSIDGPIRPDVPVSLFPTQQEWIITPGKGDNVYRWVSSSRLCILCTKAYKENGCQR